MFNKNKKRQGLAFLLLLMTATVTYAQTADDALRFSQQLPGTGTRMVALGGAGIAGVADYGALIANPAGLGYLEASQVGGAFSGFAVQNEGTYETPGFDAITRTQSVTDYEIGNVALAYKFPTERGSFVLAAALNQTRTFERDLDFENQNNASSISDFFLPINPEVEITELAPDEEPDELFFGQEVFETETANYLLDFDPDGDGFINRPLSYIAYQTFAIDFVPSLFDPQNDAGAFVPVVAPGTTFLQAGSVTEGGGVREANFGGAVEAVKGVMVGFAGNIAFGQYRFDRDFEEVDINDENDGTGITTDFSSLRLTQRFESDLTGFSLRAGLSVALTDNLRGGLLVETPTWYTVDEAASTELETRFDNNDHFLYGDQPDDVGHTEFEYRVRTPWRFGAGLSVGLGDLMLNADALLVDWTQLQLEDIDNRGTFDAENDRIRDTFEVVLNTRVGLEYRLGMVTLRGGYAYQPDPRDLSFELPDGETADASKTFYSLGLGYQFDPQFQLDFGWRQERFNDRYLPYNLENATFVNEEVQRNQFLVGITYSF